MLLHGRAGETEQRRMKVWLPAGDKGTRSVLVITGQTMDDTVTQQPQRAGMKVKPALSPVLMSRHGRPHIGTNGVS